MVRLEFTDATAGEISTGQGIDSIDEWAKFDADDVMSLLRTVRKLGGGGNGEMISYNVEMNLQAAVLFINHKHRTRRTVDYANITVPKIEAWPHVKSARKNHDGRKTRHDFYTLKGVSTCTRTSFNKPTVL